MGNGYYTGLEIGSWLIESLGYQSDLDRIREPRPNWFWWCSLQPSARVIMNETSD